MLFLALEKAPQQPGFDYFLSQNAWWIALCFAGLIVLVLVLIFLSGKKKKAKNTCKTASKNDYLQALGGEENIISSTRSGSRIVIKLKNYESINKEKLKEAGVGSFILMSDKLTLVIEGDSETVYKTIFGE